MLNLWQYERKVFSQNGEDGVIEEIFARIARKGRFYVEFGVGPDARECNTRLLKTQGWDGRWFDPRAASDEVIQETITVENVNDVFERHGIPRYFDLLSIDINGNDFWVWKAIDGFYFRPRVVVIEYNAALGPNRFCTIPYDPDFQWDRRSDYFGASLSALESLGRSKGYGLLYCESSGCNAFFVERSLLTGFWPAVVDVFQPPRYGPRGDGHEHDSTRPWVEV